MMKKKTLLSADNLNNAFISKSDTGIQSISGNLTINGGTLTLKNSFISDLTSSSYMRIDPQGNKVIIYDGVNNQGLDIYSSSGSEALQLTSINGATSYSLIDITGAVDHLKLMGNSGKKVEFGGNISLNKNTPRIDMTNSLGVTSRIEQNENGNLWISADGGKDTWINWLSTNSPTSKTDLSVGDGNSGNAILHVQGSTRRVGINTTSPSADFNVAGTAKIDSTLTINGQTNTGTVLKLPSNGEIHSGYNNTFFIKDHANGNITLSATGAHLYLGYVNTTAVRLHANLTANDGSTLIAGEDGALYYKGSDTDGRYVNKAGDTYTGTHNFTSGDMYWSRDTDRAYIRMVDYGADEDWLTIDFGDSSSDLVRFRNDRAGTFYNIFEVQGAGLKSYVPLDMSNAYIENISSLNGQYGPIASSTDEWLRLNDGGGHTSGIYMGSSIVRTDGELQVGSAGDTFLASPSSLTYKGYTIWHSGNDGSGSGLDADSVDGTHLSGLGQNFDIGTSGNANTLTQSGFYRLGATPQNTPSGMDYGQILTIHGAHDTITQIASRYNADELFFRAGNPTDVGGTGTWRSWSRIWNDNNFNPSSKVDLSGDTMTGSLIAPYLYASAADNTSVKLGVWGATNSYGIGMSSAFTYGYLNDYAMFFNMNNDADRGWIWRYDGQGKNDGAMSLTTNGNLYLKGVSDVGSANIRGNLSIDSNPAYRSINIDRGGYRNEISMSSDGKPQFIRRNLTDNSIETNLQLADGHAYVNSNTLQSWEYTSPSFTSPSAGWYRIAQRTGGGRAYGRIILYDVSGGNHHMLDFTAGAAYNQPAGMNLHVLGKVQYGSGEVIGGIRILYATTYDNMYLEVWLQAGANVAMRIEDGHHSWMWEPMYFSGPQAIPAGYSDYKLEMQDGWDNRPKNILTGTGSPPSQGSAPGDVFISY